MTTSSEDFKQAIRAGNIHEAFLVAMSNAPELNITTRIITADDRQNQLSRNQPQGDNSLCTHISLIEGKVENEIGEQLTGDRYTEIKQFHIEQVTQGHQTIQHNLVSLQKMFHLMSAFQEQQTSGQSNCVDIAADLDRDALPAKRKASQLSGNKATEAIAAKEMDSRNEGEAVAFNLNSAANSAMENSEPQLPFVRGEEDEDLVDDLLSLTDLDDDGTDEDDQENSQSKQGDWGDWLEEESEVKPEVFNLKSLNIGQAAQNWQNWESEAHSRDSNPDPEKEQN